MMLEIIKVRKAHKMQGIPFHRTLARAFYNNLMCDRAMKYMRDNKAELDFY